MMDGPRQPGLLDLIREDWVANGRDWTRPGFRTLAVYRLGVWRMKLRQPWRAPMSVLYRLLFRRCRNIYGIELPYSATIGRKVVIEHQGGIVIHGQTVIGDGCIIRQGVTLGNRTLQRPHDAPVLGRGVNVGAGAKVLGKVQVGEAAVIGANAVVLQDIPPGAVAVGVPARILGIRSEANQADEQQETYHGEQPEQQTEALNV